MIMHKFGLLSALLVSTFLVTACGGGGGGSSTPVATPAPPPTPTPPPASLTIDVQLPVGDPTCFRGGVRTDTGLDDNGNGTLEANEVDSSTFACTSAEPNAQLNFTRIATFPVCIQQEANCDTNIQRAAEMLDVSEDGNLLIYTDAPRQTVGFVDITDPSNPGAAGTRDVPGLPTSIAVRGNFALVTVNRSEGTGPNNGSLEVINLTTRTIARSILINGFGCE